MNPQAEVQAQTQKVRLQPAVTAPRFRGRRVTFVYPVQVQVLDGAAPAMRAEATNLSLGGMFIHALRAPPPGTRVKVLLEVRGRALAFADAEVRWVRSSAFASYPWCPGFGVRFLSLPPRSLALVHHLVTAAAQRGAREAPETPETGPELDQMPPTPPFPRLPVIGDLEAPLDQKDFGTKLMFPVLPAEPAVPVATAAPVARYLPVGAIAPAEEAPQPFSAFTSRRRGWGGWRWLRWGLAIAAVAGWMAALSQGWSPDQLRASAAKVVQPRP
jgi:PilZ domain-containing protein